MCIDIIADSTITGVVIIFLIGFIYALVIKILRNRKNLQNSEKENSV